MATAPRFHKIPNVQANGREVAQSIFKSVEAISGALTPALSQREREETRAVFLNGFAFEKTAEFSPSPFGRGPG
jgi:hypothetical protein